MAVSSSKVDIWNRALTRIGQELLEDENSTSNAAQVCKLHYDDIIVEVLEAIAWTFAKKQIALSSVATASTSHTGDTVETDFAIPFAFSEVSQISVTVAGVTQVQDTDYSVQLPDVDLAVEGKIVFVAAPAAVAIVITGTFSRIGWTNIYGLPADLVTPIALLDTDGLRYDLVSSRQRLPYGIMANEGGTGTILCTDQTVGDGFDKLEYIGVTTYVPGFPRQFVDAVAWRLASELAGALPKVLRTVDYCMGRYVSSIDLARVNMRNQESLGLPSDTPSIAVRS